MGKTFFVIFLFTGFCVISVSSTWYYYFIKRSMTFDEAFDYCLDKYDAFYTPQSSFINSFLENLAKNKTDMVWVGLHARTLPWTGMDGQPAKYLNWDFNQPNGGIDEICGVIGFDGRMHDQICSMHKQSICSNGGQYSKIEMEMSWIDAVANCEAKNSSLVHIQNKTMNDEIRTMVWYFKDVWIDLTTSVEWYWVNTGESTTFLNWKEGQPDNLRGKERCAAMDTKDGTWSDERCDKKYYFFCLKKKTTTGGDSGKEDETKVQKTKQTVVKLKIQTTANMEDPEACASLERQLSAMLAKQGVTDFKLTWRKLPEKETQNKRKGAS